MSLHRSPLVVSSDVVPLALREPFVISGYRFTEMPVLRVLIREGEWEGRGEAAGVYYLQDRPPEMAAGLEGMRQVIEAGISREALRGLLPPGGLRNGLDCALWDLEARRTGRPVWQLAGLLSPRPLATTITLGAADPAAMAASALALADMRALKLKLTGDTAADIERVRAVRAARPDVWLSVDANQGFTPASIEALLPVLVSCSVSLLEQPFARGREADMALVDFPMPTAADESCLHLEEIDALDGRFDLVNIKLDKCGGLTEALMMVRRARQLKLGVMVGNMGGTSLAMAPAMLVGQLCDVVDLDGPTILVQDVVPGVRYGQGLVECPEAVWGGVSG